MSAPITFRPRQIATLAPTQKFPFEIRLLDCERDRRDIFALRYRAYRSAEHICDIDSGEYTDAHDALSSSVILAAYDHNTCAGALRVSFSMPWQPLETLPCAPYYSGVEHLKREAKGGLVEMSRLAIEPSLTNTSYRTTLYASLVRAGFLAAQAARVSMILVATKPEWVRFYEYMLGFKRIGEPAFYPPGNIPIALLAGSLELAQKRQRAQNAFFKVATDEIASMRAAIAPALAPVEEPHVVPVRHWA
jgi:hypothetical protein